MANLIAGLPWLDLTFNARIVFEARDATTGAPVTGVVIRSAAIYGDQSFGASAAPELPAETPLYTVVTDDPPAEPDPTPDPGGPGGT